MNNERILINRLKSFENINTTNIDAGSSFAAIGGNSNYNRRTKQLSTEYLQDFYKELLKK